MARWMNDYDRGFRDGEDNVIEAAKLLRKTPMWVEAGQCFDIFINGLHIEVLLKRPSMVEENHQKKGSEG